MCAHALARAHARSGDAAILAGYMGSGQTFDDAIGEFAVEYADQSMSDYRAFIQAIRDGRIRAQREE
jgi:predicted alpha/beta hydrolase